MGDSVDAAEPKSFAGDLTSLDDEKVRAVVRAVSSREALELQEWRAEPLTEGSTGGGAIHRLLGTGIDQGKSVSWSLILKSQSSLSPSLTDANSVREVPTHWEYWKRELLVYQSELFANLPEGLAVPHCYEIDTGSTSYRLWLEDIQEESRANWPLDRFGLAARHLGRFAGIYLLDGMPHDWPWLATSILRQRAERAARQNTWDNFPVLWEQQASFRRHWPKEVADRFQQIWADRELFFRTLARLPQTLQHGDASRKNLLNRRRNGKSETVALDWGMAGTGAVGEEIAPLVCATVLWFGGVDANQLVELDETVFAGYVQGLEDAGWRGDLATVRQGYTTTVALRFGPLTPVLEIMALDEAGRTKVEQIVGRPLDEILANALEIRRYVLSCATEARELMYSA